LISVSEGRENVLFFSMPRCLDADVDDEKRLLDGSEWLVGFVLA
jgi:hypothetical protein